MLTSKLRYSSFLIILIALAVGCSDGSNSPPPQLVEPEQAADTFGPWAVGHRRGEAIDVMRDNRQLPYDVWYPVDDADAAPEPRTIYPLNDSTGLTAPRAVEDLLVSSAGNLSLLIFSHGFCGTNTQSTLLMETLASHGFVVVSPEHTGNINDDCTDTSELAAAKRVPDVSFFIDTFLMRNDSTGDDFYQRLDPQSIGVLGHSFGGATALGAVAGFADAAADERVLAVLPISASVIQGFTDEALAAVEEPVLFLGGTLDTAVPIENHNHGFNKLTGARAVFQVDIVGATHTHFANICDIANWLIDAGIGPDLWPAIGAEALLAPYEEACSEEAFPIEEAHRIQNVYGVAFFRRYLRGETQYDYYLQPQYARMNEPDIDYRARR